VHIVHVSDVFLPRLGGIERQVADLAARQSTAGHDVAVLTATAGSGTGTEDGVGAVGVEVVRLGRGTRLTGLPRDAAARVAAADVVHVHLCGVAPLAWAALRLRITESRPIVVTVHSMLDRMRLLHRLLREVEGWDTAPVVWCGVSRIVADQLHDLLGPSATVHVVPNAVDPAAWAPPHPRGAVPSEQSEEHADPTVRPPERAVLLVAALRHTRRKRAEALPGILAGVARRLPPGTPVRAVIAGTGHRTAALRRGLHAHGVAGWVDLPGRLTTTELRDLYHRADIFVAPTVVESFGLAALEARAAGLPVVARAESGSGEVFEPGREGLLVEDDDAMSAAVARLVVDRPLRQAIAEHNRATPVAFDWPATLALTEHAYVTAARLVGAPLATARVPPEERPLHPAAAGHR
jgi:glycosyltransferase involved in cell wall biosynthesis